jgi:hypothetical protein
VKNARSLNLALYAALLILGLSGLARHDATTAVVGLGLSLAFDPFDVTVPFPHRPLWQKSLLIAQVALLFVVIAIELWSTFLSR